MAIEKELGTRDLAFATLRDVRGGKYGSSMRIETRNGREYIVVRPIVGGRPCTQKAFPLSDLSGAPTNGFDEAIQYYEHCVRTRFRQKLGRPTIFGDEKTIGFYLDEYLQERRKNIKTRRDQSGDHSSTVVSVARTLNKICGVIVSKKGDGYVVEGSANLKDRICKETENLLREFSRDQAISFLRENGVHADVSNYTKRMKYYVSKIEIEKYKTDRRFMLGSLRFVDLSEQVLIDAIKLENGTANTRYNAFREFKAFIGALYESHADLQGKVRLRFRWMEDRHFPRPPKSKGDIEHLNSEDILKVFNMWELLKAKGRNFRNLTALRTLALMILSTHIGTRIGELLAITKEEAKKAIRSKKLDITGTIAFKEEGENTGRIVFFRQPFPKGDEHRSFEIGSKSVEIIRFVLESLDIDPKSEFLFSSKKTIRTKYPFLLPGSVSSQFSSMCEKIGIPDLGTHSLGRKTFINLMLDHALAQPNMEREKALRFIADVVGHREIATTLNAYVKEKRLPKEQTRSLMESFSGFLLENQGSLGQEDELFRFVCERPEALKEILKIDQVRTALEELIPAS